MATLRLVNNVFSDEISNAEIDAGSSVENLVKAYAQSSDYNSTLVECYDADTGKTFYATLEDTDEAAIHAVVTVNGEDTTLDYVIKEGDFVTLMFLPASKSQGLGALFGGIAGAIMGAGIGNFICPGLGALIGAGIGLIVGAVVGLIVGPYLTPDMSADNQKKLTAKTKDLTSLPDVRGSQNQPILGNPIPFVLGKHLTTPFIAGSPYNIIKGVYGDTNEIHVLYIVGYGPLALTDFKLGDRLLAYNRANPNDENAGTVFTGALTKETGDILSVWDSNDIELEILQQNPSSDEVNYGKLYPYARIQQDVKANIIYIKDGSEPTVNYKGVSLTNGVRTNSVRFTNPYPASASVELDFPSGLYNTWSQSLDGNTVQHYQSMPLWLAVEWRPYMETNPESDPSKSDNNNELSYWQTNKATWDNNKENLPTTRPWMSFSQISSNEKYFYTNVTITSQGSLVYYAKKTRIRDDVGKCLPATHPSTVDLYKTEIVCNNLNTETKIRYDFSTITATSHTIKITYRKRIYYTALFKTYEYTSYRNWGITYGDIPFNTFEQDGSSTTYTDEITVPAGERYFEKTYSDGWDTLSGAYYQDSTQVLWGKTRVVNIQSDTDLHIVTKFEIIGFYVDGVDCTDKTNSSETAYSVQRTFDAHTYIVHMDDSFSATEKKPIKSNTYTTTERASDINAHVGNDLGSASAYNPNWIDKPAFNLSGLGASSIKDSSINEFRAIADIDFEKWARANFTYSTEEEFIEKYKAYFFPVGNTIKAVEVRVVRISANYINTTGTTNVTYEGHTYQKGSTTFNDHFTWDTLSSEMFDSQKLDTGTLVRKRPVRDDIYKKCCLIALKAKVDNLENLSSTLEKFTCEAHAFAPTFDEDTNTWLPELVSPVVKYYKPNTQDITTVNGKTIVISGHGEEITEEQYLEDRQNGIKSIKQKDGNDFYAQMALQIWHGDYIDSESRLVIPKDAYVRKLLENNVASSILLAGIGSHLGIHALSYDDFDLHSLGELFTFCKAVKDGSIYKDTGFHYDHDGNKVLHEAGDEVETYYTANAYIYNTVKMEDLFSKLAIAGRSVYTRKGMNKLTFIIDKPEDYPVGLINQMNTLSSSSVISYKDLPAGITISFNDENDGYRKNTVDIFKDGEKEEDYRGSLESYNIDYVTNPYQLYSLGRYVLANRILNREVLYRRVGAEGATFSLGSLVVVSDPQIMIGTDLGGRITKILEDEDYIYGFVINSTYNYTGNTQGVIINQPLQLGASRVLKVQLKDPCSLILDGVEYVLQKGQTNLVIFNQAWAKNTYDTIHIAPQIDNSVSFGLYSEDLVLYRIIGIKSTENFQYDLTLVKYQEGLYHSGITLPTFQLNYTPQPYSADAFGANTAITRADLDNQKVQTEQVMTERMNEAITLNSSKIVLDVSPDVQSVLVIDGILGADEVYVDCFCYYRDRLLTLGTEVTFSAKIGTSTLLTWTDNRLTVSTSYLTGNTLQIAITATVTVDGETYTRTQNVTVNRLYSSEAGKIYKMQFPYGEKIKVFADRRTKVSSKIKAIKRVITAEGERDTEYGYITVEPYPTSQESIYAPYTKINPQEQTEYSSEDLYFGKFSPILISAGNGNVLAVEQGTAALFFRKEN